MFHFVWVGCVEGPLVFLVQVDGSSFFQFSLLVWRGPVFHWFRLLVWRGCLMHLVWLSSLEGAAFSIWFGLMFGGAACFI